MATTPTPPQTPTLRLRLDRVKVARQMRDLGSDQDLAEAMGVSQSSVSRVFRGLQEPGPKFIAALCIALGVDKIDMLVMIERPQIKVAA